MERKKFSKHLHVKPTFRHRFKPFILFIQLRKDNNKNNQSRYKLQQIKKFVLFFSCLRRKSTQMNFPFCLICQFSFFHKVHFTSPSL